MKALVYVSVSSGGFGFVKLLNRNNFTFKMRKAAKALSGFPECELKADTSGL